LPAHSKARKEKGDDGREKKNATLSSLNEGDAPIW